MARIFRWGETRPPIQIATTLIGVTRKACCIAVGRFLEARAGPYSLTILITNLLTTRCSQRMGTPTMLKPTFYATKAPLHIFPRDRTARSPLGTIGIEVIVAR